MGTRRSKHNKGRKPLYKEHRQNWFGVPDLAALLGTANDNSAIRLSPPPDAPVPTWKRRRSLAGNFLEQREVNQLSERLRLGSSLRAASRDLGIDRKTVRRYAALIASGADLAAWAPPQITEPPRPSISVPLQYPYIARPRDDHALLIEVNALIPKSIPDHMRSDMCQEIILAVLEGRTTIDQLRDRQNSGVYFIKKFYRDNFEQSGDAASLDEMQGGRSYYDIASSIAAKEWHQSELSERRSAWDSMATIQPPTQIEDTFQGQVRRRWIALQEGALASGDMRNMLSMVEVADLMEAGEI